jgi:hypothetical protein
MKRSFFYIISIIICLSAAQCGSNPQNVKENNLAATDSNAVKKETDTVVMLAGINSKGIGRFQNIQLTHPLDETMVAKGQKIYQF